MKKAVLILFLFCAKTLSAQQLYLGGGTGLTIYNFAQQPDYGNLILDMPSELYIQYIFKDSDIGFESNLVYELLGPNLGINNDGGRITDFTTVNYFMFNPLYRFKVVSAQVKLGLFYAHYFTPYIFPQNDFGPALALNLSFKISRMAYLGVEVSRMYGLARYNLNWNAPPDPNIPPNYDRALYSNITYTTFLIKYVRKF